MTELIASVAAGLGTYLSRSVFIIALAKRAIPAGLIAALQFVAPSVLASLVIALLIDADGNVAIGIPELAALAVGGFVALRTRNHVYTLIAGMTIFWVVGAIF